MTCQCGFAHNSEGATQCKLCGVQLAPSAPTHASQGTPPVSDGRRHQLVAEGSQPIALVPNKVFTLGRAPECELPIPSQRVSRQHAAITWRAGLPLIQNVSSTGSTLVNGKAIKDHELRDGDKIQVGPYECTYTVLAPGATLKLAPQPATGGVTMIDEGGDALAGNLAEMSLFSLLRGFEVRGQTGTLVVRQGTQQGTLILDKGKLTSADFDGQKQGKAALFLVLAWREGTYTFSLEKKAATGRIFRTFNYNTIPTASDLKKGVISDLLEEAQDAGVEEPLPPGRKPVPRAAPPPPPRGAGRTDRAGAPPPPRRTLPPPGGAPPPRGR